MLSYESVMKIPVNIRLEIIDAIDTRDHIIDTVLKKIEIKHDQLINENESLKKKIDNCENKIIMNDKKYNFMNEYSYRENLQEKSDPYQEYQGICEEFENYNYVHVKKKNNIMPKQKIHIKMYTVMHKLLNKKGHEIKLTEINNTTIDNLVHGNDTLNIDAIDTMTPYDNKMRPRKFLSSLAGILTDYVSENVHVEKVLDRLDLIINFMNNDSDFIEFIFKKMKNFDQDNEIGKIGIIFKGGNVYKLFSEILDQNLDASIFHHYLSEIDKFFKKSDCDFSLVFISTNKKSGKSRYIHLERTDENETMICTLQYMILNKFRNDFLHENNGYEYLNMCGVNDTMITKKMKKIGDKISNQIHEGRLEFESNLFALLIDTIPFESGSRSVDFLNTFKSLKNIKKYITITWPFPETQTLRGILKKKANDYVNRGTVFNVTSGNISDWYDVFLFHAMRGDDHFLNPRNNEFRNLVLPMDIITKIQKIDTDEMQWKDIKILYNVKETTNIIIGNNNYRIQHNDVHSEEIFRHIVSDEKKPDKIADILAHRMRRTNKLSSNRDDFFIKFLSDDILNINKIPFDNTNKSLKTPFYISINKEITGQNVALQKQENIPHWLRNMRRYSDYGSSGYIRNNDVRDNPYIDVYKKIMERVRTEKMSGNKIGRNSINFGLGRLMMSFSVIFKTYDNNYFALPVSGEYIDLSYSYESDYKTLIYENYEGYTLLNEEMLGNNYIGTIMRQYIDVIDYTKTQFIGDMVNGGLELSEALNESDTIISGLYEMNYDVINSNKLIITKINEIINNTSINIDTKTFLKILKYRSTSHDNHISSLSFNTIFFPKLNGFISDLYSILFIDSEFPWTDQKYAKRLQRLIFFTFIEQMQKINIDNLDSLILDIGLQPGALERIKTNIKNYDMDDTFWNMIEYNDHRSTTIADYNEIIYDNTGMVQSVGAIDRFMFGYHLLDFLNTYEIGQDYIRSQFIVKHIIDNKKVYVLISLAINKDINLNQIEQIFNGIPNTLQELTDINNKNSVVLPNKRKIARYTIIEGKFLKYIETINEIREKLIITIYNYIHREILNSNSMINVVNVDPVKILLNTYEGEIDKILRVMS